MEGETVGHLTQYLTLVAGIGIHDVEVPRAILMGEEGDLLAGMASLRARDPPARPQPHSQAQANASPGLLSPDISPLWALCEGDIYAQFLPLAEDGECYLLAHVEAP